MMKDSLLSTEIGYTNIQKRRDERELEWTLDGLVFLHTVVGYIILCNKIPNQTDGSLNRINDGIQFLQFGSGFFIIAARSYIIPTMLQL